MKTTTYSYAGGELTILVTDQPEITPAGYAQACRVLNLACFAKQSRKDAVKILREAATKTQLMTVAWMLLVHAAQTLEGTR